MGHGTGRAGRDRLLPALWGLGVFLWSAACGWLVRRGWADDCLEETLQFSGGFLAAVLAFYVCLGWWPGDSW